MQIRQSHYVLEKKNNAAHDQSMPKKKKKLSSKRIAIRKNMCFG